MENQNKGKSKLVNERRELLQSYLKADKENHNDELVKKIADVEYELNMLKIEELNSKNNN